MKKLMEFCIEWLRGSDYVCLIAWVGAKLKNTIMRLQLAKPDEIIALNKDS